MKFSYHLFFRWTIIWLYYWLLLGNNVEVIISAVLPMDYHLGILLAVVGKQCCSHISCSSDRLSFGYSIGCCWETMLKFSYQIFLRWTIISVTYRLNARPPGLRNWFKILRDSPGSEHVPSSDHSFIPYLLSFLIFHQMQIK